MAARPQDRTRASATPDAKTAHRAEAKERKADPSPDHDSPKHHGDKMEHAARAAAGLPEKD